MDGWYSDGTLVVFACGGGLFNSVINILLLIGANSLSKRVSENSLW